MPDLDDNLESIVKSYLSTHDIYKINDYRNSILLSVNSNKGSQFLSILDNFYEQEDDPADKKDVLKLLYEVISRTEGCFAPSDVIAFLSKCLKLTICVHLCVNTTKALLDRHFAGVGDREYQTLYDFYKQLLDKRISHYPQQCRIEFLHISHFVVDLVISGTLTNLNIELLCDSISEEKDPRNLLVMLDLLSKLASKVATAESHFESIFNTYSVYYPIQFVPPKKDKICITPLQLKKSLLSCFKSHRQLAQHSMGLLLDSLYSELSVDSNLSVVRDTLHFLKSCKPVYGAHFNSFVRQFVQVLTLELLGETPLDKIPDDLRIPIVEPRSGSNAPNLRLNDSLSSDALNNSRYIDSSNSLGYSDQSSNDKINHLNSKSDDSTANNVNSLSDVLEDKFESNHDLNTDLGELNMNQINKMGKFYRRECHDFDEKVKLFGEITRLFVDSIGDLGEYELMKFLVSLGKGMYSNNALAYIVEVLCENSSLHNKIIECVVLPLLKGIYAVDDDPSNSHVHNEANESNIYNLHDIITMCILPKLLMYFKGDNISEELLIYLVGIDKDNVGFFTDSTEAVYKHLNLLILASTIVNGKSIYELIEKVIVNVFTNEDFSFNITYAGFNVNDEATDAYWNEVVLNMKILASISKTHTGALHPIVKMLNSMVPTTLKSKDTSFILNRIPYLTKRNNLMLSSQMAELFGITLTKWSKSNLNDDIDSLARKLTQLIFTRLEKIIKAKNHKYRNIDSSVDQHRSSYSNSSSTNSSRSRSSYSSFSKSSSNSTSVLSNGSHSSFSRSNSLLNNSKNNNDALSSDESDGSSTTRTDSVLERDFADAIFVLYLTMLVELLESESKCLLLEMFDSARLLGFFESLLSYYKHALALLEASPPYEIFRARRVPIILSNLSSILKINPRKYMESNILFLNVYFNIPELFENLSKHTQTYLENVYYNRGSVGLSLLNLESLFLYNGYFKHIDRLFECKYVNGSILVKCVQNMYRYDFSEITAQIKLLNNYKLTNMDYDYRFFLFLPLPLSHNNGAYRPHLIDIRDRYRTSFDPTSDSEAIKGDNRSTNTHLSDESTDRLLKALHERLMDDLYEVLPNYTHRLVENYFSKLEFHVSFLLILLNRGTKTISNEYLKFSVDSMSEVVKCIIQFQTEMCVDEKDELEQYTNWCCDKYLLYIQAILFNVVSDINNSNYSAERVNELKPMLNSKVESLVEDLLNIYRTNKLPLCRILSILTIHVIFKSKHISLDNQLRQKVIKQSTKFVGDLNKKVRAVAVLCRHKWLVNTRNN